MKKIITYQMYGNIMNELIDIIKSHKIYSTLKFIYAPPRGGLPIAVHLAHHLNLELLNYNDLIPFIYNQFKRILIVDDVADTGQTLQKLTKDFYNNFKIATLHYKPRSIIKPDFYVEETNDWIVYPWEKLDETPNREGYE